MFNFKLAAILLCACAVKGFVQFKQNVLENMDLHPTHSLNHPYPSFPGHIIHPHISPARGNIDGRKSLDCDLNVNSEVNDRKANFRLKLLKKLVSQVDGSLKFAKKLLFAGRRDELSEALREVTKHANAALHMAKQIQVPYNYKLRVYTYLSKVFDLAGKVERLIEELTSVLSRELNILEELVNDVEILLLVPVDGKVKDADLLKFK